MFRILKTLQPIFLAIWERGMPMLYRKEQKIMDLLYPFVMDLDGQWLANTISKIRIKENGTYIDLQKSIATQHYYPGLLKQHFIINGLDIEQQLIFVSGREAKIKQVFTIVQKPRKILLCLLTENCYPMSFLIKEIMK